MQEVERGYTQIALIGYFQLSDIAVSMAASCFTTSDYDKLRYVLHLYGENTTVTESYTDSCRT